MVDNVSGTNRKLAPESRAQLRDSSDLFLSKRLADLPPMKFQRGDLISRRMEVDGVIKDWVGKIMVADFGRSLENDYHSYDVEFDEINWFVKHVPEAQLSLAAALPTQ